MAVPGPKLQPADSVVGQLRLGTERVPESDLG